MFERFRGQTDAAWGCVSHAPKAPPSAVRDRIFDNKVERASRESSLELSFK